MTQERDSHGRNRTVALRKRARDLIKVIGQGSKPALVSVSNRAQEKDITIYMNISLSQAIPQIPKMLL